MFQILINREEKENFFFKILKMEKRKRMKIQFFRARGSERGQYFSRFLEIRDSCWCLVGGQKACSWRRREHDIVLCCGSGKEEKNTNHPSYWFVQWSGEESRHGSERISWTERNGSWWWVFWACYYNAIVVITMPSSLLQCHRHAAADVVDFCQTLSGQRTP